MAIKDLTCIVMHNVIDRTNRFYIEMSKQVLSEKEYDLLQKLLIDKMPLSQAAEQYGVTSEYVQELYEKTCNKVKAATELICDDYYKKKLQELKRELNPNPSPSQIRKEKAEKRPAGTALPQFIYFQQKTAKCNGSLRDQNYWRSCRYSAKGFSAFQGI
ncbi:hypothetical protein [Flavobacterium sp. CGRL2]